MPSLEQIFPAVVGCILHKGTKHSWPFCLCSQAPPQKNGIERHFSQKYTRSNIVNNSLRASDSMCKSKGHHLQLSCTQPCRGLQNKPTPLGCWRGHLSESPLNFSGFWITFQFSQHPYRNHFCLIEWSRSTANDPPTGMLPAGYHGQELGARSWGLHQSNTNNCNVPSPTGSPENFTDVLEAILQQ